MLHLSLFLTAGKTSQPKEFVSTHVQIGTVLAWPSENSHPGIRVYSDLLCCMEQNKQIVCYIPDWKECKIRIA